MWFLYDLVKDLFAGASRHPNCSFEICGSMNIFRNSLFVMRKTLLACENYNSVGESSTKIMSMAVNQPDVHFPVFHFSIACVYKICSISSNSLSTNTVIHTTYFPPFSALGVSTVQNNSYLGTVWY